MVIDQNVAKLQETEIDNLLMGQTMRDVDGRLTAYLVMMLHEESGLILHVGHSPKNLENSQIAVLSVSLPADISDESGKLTLGLAETSDKQHLTNHVVQVVEESLTKYNSQ